MTEQSPRVSIGLPVYNAEEYLHEALDSLLAQSYADFELIISDNASNDQTESICREYAARDSRIRYVRQEENRGCTWNFNSIVPLARGTYFKWAAHDDFCAPEFLERCVEVLENDPDVVWCHSRTRHIDEFSEVISTDDDPNIPHGFDSHSLLRSYGCDTKYDRAAASPHHRFYAVLLGSTWCSDHYALIRTHVLRQTRLLLPYYGAEKVLLAELGLCGRFAEVPETLFFTRTHAGATTSLLTAAEQQAWDNPKSRKRLQFLRWHLLTGYVTAVTRAKLPIFQRLRCFGYLLQYLVQIRKWKRVFGEVFFGDALGDDTQIARRATRTTPSKTPATHSTP